MGMDAAQGFKIKVQFFSGTEIALGPGKADMLEAIHALGSIAAAGRQLGMSYRRAWLLVDTMNRCWQEPLVLAAPEGSARSGARLTATGEAVLAEYRALQRRLADTARCPEAETLEALLRAEPRVRQGD
jgi:molybdate transport system regulatory protein